MGQEAADVISNARAIEISNARAMSGAKKRGALQEELDLKGKVEKNIISQKEAAKISVKAFEKLSGLRQGINIIDEAISLTQKGVATGPIISRFPSLKTNAVRLDNLQGRMGLDVIQNTTFGSLSEAEMQFALDTALPTKLKGQELTDWLQRKKAAQENLADYIESAAIFLEQPGNTVGKWFQKKRGQSKETVSPAQKSTTTAQPQEFNFDAQGNLI